MRDLAASAGSPARFCERTGTEPECDPDGAWQPMTRVGLALWLTAALAALAGCAEPLRRTYTLGSIGDGQSATRVESQMPVLEIRPVSVPDYLDTRDILIRQGPNEISASTTGRWAERLSFGIAHALAAALAKRLPQLAVTTIRRQCQRRGNCWWRSFALRSMRMGAAY